MSSMRIFLAFTILYSLFLSAQTSDGFSVRLTEEEQASPCCPPPAPSCCGPGPSNCPPAQPPFERCDCLFDYYNPLLFKGIDLSIEWLFWKVHQKASTYVLEPSHFQQPYPPTQLTDGLGKYKSAEFDWSSGVRAGIGYTFQRDAWHILGQYTYYSTHGHSHEDRSGNLTQYLQATNRDINGSNLGPISIKSSSKFHYQTADLLFSRRFIPGTQILFEFFTGGTGAWIDEHWKVLSSSASQTLLKNDWIFSGGGIRTGVQANWHMGGGFGFYNKISGAALVGSYKNRKKEAVTPLTVSEQPYTNPLANTTEKGTWVVPHSQIELGMNLSHRFCTWAMNLAAGFEINTWYDLHQLHQSMQDPLTGNQNQLDTRNASDVSLWGIHIDFSFSY